VATAAAAAGAGSQCMTARGLYRYRISAHGPLAREREREKERQRRFPGGRGVITTRADRSSRASFPRAPKFRLRKFAPFRERGARTRSACDEGV